MIQEETVVVHGKEASLPIVSALDYVHRQSSSLKAGLAWHKSHYITE